MSRIERFCWACVVMFCFAGILSGCGLGQNPSTSAAEADIAASQRLLDSAKASGASQDMIAAMQRDLDVKKAENDAAKAAESQKKIHDTLTVVGEVAAGLGGIGGGVALAIRFADVLAQTPLIGGLFAWIAGKSRSQSQVDELNARLDAAKIPPTPGA